MINSVYKKFAVSKGLNVSNGVAYGSLDGYATTLSEGAGFKRIDVTTYFEDVDDLKALEQELNAIDLKREYRITQIAINQRSINIIFYDNPGTMKKLTAFVEYFYPLLAKYNAATSSYCPDCKQEIFDGKWILIDGLAYHMHAACAGKVRWEVAAEEGAAKMTATGSYGMGLLGAIIGAFVGGLVWAAALLAGFISALIGLLIGFLAQYGYKLFKGKQGKGKIAILIVAIIFGVLVGNFAADSFTLAQMISAGELPGWTYGDIPLSIVAMLIADSEYLTSTLLNLGQGLLFAALGVFALLRKASKEVTGTKVKDL